jgi:hypothetical protein
MKETDMLATKLDLLMKRLDEGAPKKEARYDIVKAMDSQMTYEVCGDVGHSRNDYPETCEDTAFINNRFHQQGGNNGWNNQSCPPFQGNSNYNSNYNSNQPSLKDLVLGQAKINENLTKKLMSNNKILQNINSKIENLTSFVKNQLSFNKMIETQIAQIVAALPANNEGKILGQPENSLENVKAVTTRGGKSTCDPLNHNHKVGRAKEHQVEEPSSSSKKTQKDQEEEEMAPQAPLEYTDTTYLLFPTRNRKTALDEQFTHFVEMIEKIHVSVPLMDILHVPSYAKYIKDIINNKRPLPSIEVVKLTEECSAPIFNCLPKKKKDPGCPTITCSIGAQQFDHALCDLGASVSVMTKVVFDQLNYTHLAPTPMMLQLADSSVYYPAGITEDIPMKIWAVVLNMEITNESPLILGWPFLSTTGAQIDVGTGEIHFNINGKGERFEFWPDIKSNAP